MQACRLLKHPNITLTPERMRAEHAKRHNITVDTLTAELEEARDTAMGIGQISAAVSAIMGKAKLHGLLIQKIQSEAPRDLCELTDAQLEALIRGGLTDAQREDLEAIKKLEEIDGKKKLAPCEQNKKPH